MKPKKVNGDKFAFPSDNSGDFAEHGLSKRELMAITIMAGLVTSERNASKAWMAEYAVTAADALLAELSK
jgi:hypothetical protein